VQTRALLTIVCFLVLCVTSHAVAGEKEIDIKDLPKAVADAIKAKYPNAKLEEATVDDEDGKTTFEVEIEEGQNELTISLSPEGKILEVEKEVDVKDLPEAVLAAINAKYPKAEIEEAELVTADGQEFYEILIETDNEKSLEVKLDKAGKILKIEEVEEEKEEN